MGSKYKQDFLTFTTPLDKRIPRPGPSQQTIQDRRLAALEAKCGKLERSEPTWGNIREQFRPVVES